MADTYYICTEPDCTFSTRYRSHRRAHEYQTGHVVGVRRLDEIPSDPPVATSRTPWSLIDDRAYVFVTGLESE